MRKDDHRVFGMDGFVPGDISMYMPLSSFPAFWITFAGFCVLIAIYLAIFAYKRNRGEKVYFPIETIAFWIDGLLLGKKDSKSRLMLLERDQRRNRMMVVSARVVSGGCLIMAIYSIIVALLLP